MALFKGLFKSILLAGLPILQGIEEQTEEELLDKVYEHSPEDHKAIVQSQYIAFKRLRAYADNTTTKVDDTLLDGTINALKASAEAHGVELAD